MENQFAHEVENENIETPPKRPKFLSVLCILTFIFTGLGILSCLLTPVFADMLKGFIVNAPNYNEAEQADSLKVIGAGWGYYMLTLLLTIGSLVGAILMWKLKKNGFHFYAFSNLAVLFLPTLVLGIAISWFGIVLTVAFIGMYGLHLKFMR